MSKEKQEKSYFIQDTELHDSDQDFFHHSGVSDNLRRVVENNSAPFNVAVIGKWGLGKSSLINLALQGLMSDEARYKRVDINAWKYEKETLSKVFLNETIQALSGNKETSQEQANSGFLNRVKQIFSGRYKERNFFDELKTFLKSIWIYLVLWILIAFVAYSFYKWRLLGLSGEWIKLSCLQKWDTVLTGFLRNSIKLIAVPFLLAILGIILQEIKNKSFQRVGYLPPDLNVEDYEILLGREVKKHKGCKIIIVVDDLDRLSAPKMVEALDAIKMFMGFQQCIFVVPFDDSILKDAIQRERLDDSSGHSLAGSDELLDKLFQYKLYLTPVLSYDIKGYAEKLCKENLSDFFRDYTDDNGERFITAVRRILIYSGVTTPRQVKKLINTYVNYIMLARDRENVGRVRAGFTDNGIDIMAKFSVLQADFNDVYDILFDDENALDEILDSYGSWVKYQENEEDEQSWVSDLSEAICRAARIDDSDKPFTKAMPLINFLQHTRGVESEDFLSYLYVAEDRITRATGTKNRKDFIDAATSSNVDEARRLLKENGSLAEAADVYIQEISDAKDIMAVISVISNCTDRIDEKSLKNIANSISDVADNIVEECDESDLTIIDFDGTLQLYGLTDDKEKFDKLLMFSLNHTEDVRVSDITEAFYNNFKTLSTQVKQTLAEFTNRICTDHTIQVSDLVEIRRDHIDLKDAYKAIWIDSYYDYLIKAISDCEDGEEQQTYIEELNDVFKVLSDKDYQTNIEKLKPIYGMPDMTDTMISFMNGDKKPSQETIDDIIVDQIEASEETDGANKFLETFRYDITEENGKIFDEYLIEQSAGDIIVMLRNVIRADSDVFKNIPKTIDLLIDDPIKQRTPQIENVISLVKMQDSYAWEKISALVKPLTKYNNPDYAGLADIMSERYKIEKDSTYDILNDNISFINTNSSSSNITAAFIEFNTDLIKETLATEEVDENDRQLIDKYLNVIFSVYKAGRLQDTVIHSFAELNDFIDGKLLQEAEPELYKELSDSNVVDLYNVYTVHYGVFEETQNVLSHVVDITIKAIPQIPDKNGAINFLSKHFTGISKVPELAKIVYNYSDSINQEKALPLIKRFITYGVEKNGNYSYLIDTVSYTDAEFVRKVFGSETKELSATLNEIVENKSKYTFSQKACVIDLLNRYWSDKTLYSQGTDAYLTIVDDADDEEKRRQIVGMLSSVPRQAMSSDTDKWVDILTRLYRQTSSQELKKDIVSMVMKNNLKKHFIAGLENNYVEEVKKIIKGINKSPAADEE